MSDLSNYLEEEVLNVYLRAQTPTAPAATYLAIFNDTATDAELEAGTLTNEITGYTGDRPQIDGLLNAATQVGGAAEVTTNADIDYEDMPATTVQWAAIMDSASGAGNVLAYAQSTDGAGAGTSVSAGATFRIVAGDFTFSLD